MLEARAEMFFGPLPPPEMLAQYDSALPGAAERILSMAERQMEHRHGMERSVMDGNNERARLGLKLGFALALVAVVGSMVLIWLGRDLTGLVAFIAALATLVGVFVYQVKERKKELDAKSKTRAEREAEAQEA